MHTANNILGIDEAKCLGLALRVETDAWKTAYGPARLDIFIACEPSYPEKIDVFGCWVLSFWANISDIDVKYANDSGIPVGVRVLNVLSVLHQQTNPPLYRAYTDLYSTTDYTARYLPLQSLLRLYSQLLPSHYCVARALTVL